MPTQLKTGGRSSQRAAFPFSAQNAKPSETTKARRAAALAGAPCRGAPTLDVGQDRGLCMRS
ncbi:hypothetical protein D1O30_18130 [Methylocystis hirsuta]|uniref:Uncharacterized protein n=1 Tax=Methylocystis hirsuta TaxID=369798 RepID=A0A3M9XSF7_9HYPH|nr:hypothetical protein D1O30_18130 [Methylocystis hirsuta]